MLKSALLRCSNMRALGLDPSKRYSAAEVKDAFRAKARAHHPDVSGGSESAFRQVHDAYKAVSSSGASIGSSAGCSSTSYASGDEQVYGARRPYADMYATWYPEETARQQSAEDTPQREDLKWYTFRDTTSAGFEPERRANAAASSNNKTRDTFHNPYSGDFTGPRGHEANSANESTKNFYRSCGQNGSYNNRYAGSGYTKDEIDEAMQRNRLAIAARYAKLSVVLGMFSYAVYCLTLKQDSKLRISVAAKREGYPADYIATLPDRRRQAGDDLYDEQGNQKDAAGLHAKNQQRMAAEMDTKRRASENRSYAVTYRGRPFSAEGLQELRESRRRGAAPGAQSSVPTQPPELFADDVTVEVDD